jgi:hypothetical protein
MAHGSFWVSVSNLWSCWPLVPADDRPNCAAFFCEVPETSPVA